MGQDGINLTSSSSAYNNNFNRSEEFPDSRQLDSKETKTHKTVQATMTNPSSSSSFVMIGDRRASKNPLSRFIDMIKNLIMDFFHMFHRSSSPRRNEIPDQRQSINFVPTTASSSSSEPTKNN